MGQVRQPRALFTFIRRLVDDFRRNRGLLLFPPRPTVEREEPTAFVELSLSGREDLNLRPFGPELAVAASQPVRTVRK